MNRDIPCYVIRENHMVSMPGRVLYLDTETKGVRRGQYEVHRFKLGWTCFVNYDSKGVDHKPVWMFFDDTFDLNRYIESLTQPKKPLWVFGHNIYFDLQAAEFYYYLAQFGWRYRFYYDSGLTYILSVAKGNKTLKAVSSTNYYSCSLKKLGELIGIDKLDIDLPIADATQLADYCKRDVEILKKGMEYYFQFVRENDLGRFAMTKSSQAMNAYRHGFMTHKLHRHEDKEIVDLERSAYHGGRTECFRFGEQPVDEYVTLDINSMYPYVMKNYPLPTRCIDYVQSISLENLAWVLKKYGVIAECVIKTDEPVYAVYNGEKLIFPVGEFKAYLCTGGVRYALEKGHLRRAGRCSVYDMGYIFGHYVDFMYSLRKSYESKGNAVMATLAKYLLNCLYGKFGERHQIEVVKKVDNAGLYRAVEYFELSTGKHWVEYTMFNASVRRYGSVEGKRSIVSIPAHITEYARLYLWEIMTKIGREKVYYCDTDSVKIRKADVSSVADMIDNQCLGQLKVENEFTHFIINGCKHYVCDSDVKIKGVPRTAEKIGDYRYRYMSFLRQPSHMREECNREYLLRETVKDVPPEYDKGILNPDGTISPFLLSLDDLPDSLHSQPAVAGQ